VHVGICSQKILKLLELFGSGLGSYQLETKPSAAVVDDLLQVAGQLVLC
jgi:hypothetical protein